MENTTLFNENSTVLRMFYTVLCPLSILLNVFGIYLIIFKSSQQMGEYRWHLLHYQIWVSAIDIFMNCLFQPVVFLPINADIGYGILITKFGFSGSACFLCYVDPSQWAELLRKVSAPFVLIFIPVLATFIRILDGRLGFQILNDIMMMMISSYGVFATISQNDLPTSLSNKWSFLFHCIQQINQLTTVAPGSNRLTWLKEFTKQHTLRVPPDAQRDVVPWMLLTARGLPMNVYFSVEYVAFGGSSLNLLCTPNIYSNCANLPVKHFFR
uniref:ABC2_membrane domain-containing protein n=1 Tax=Heterorhabditis bacteriophora TaxID=37862 RepID=A0A1I7X2X7_HETBA